MKRIHKGMQRKLALPGGAGRREPWRKLAESAALEARRASGLTYYPDNMPAGMRAISPLDQLRLLRRECKAADFPVEGVGAALIGEGFLKIVDAFSLREAASEQRSAWAELMRAAAEVMLRLLEEQNRAEAVGAGGYWLDRD